MQKSYSNYYEYKNMKDLDESAKDVIRKFTSRDIVRFTDFHTYYDTNYHCDMLIKYNGGFLIGDVKTISDKYIPSSPLINYNFTFRIIDSKGQKYDEVDNHPDVILFVSRGHENNIYGFLFDSIEKLLKGCMIYHSKKKETYALISHYKIKNSCDFSLNKEGVYIKNVFDDFERLELEYKLDKISNDKRNKMKELDLNKIFESLSF